MALTNAWLCLWCWNQLARGKPPGPPGTHVQSQFWCTCLIPVLVHTSHGTVHIFHSSSGALLSSESLMLHLYHSIHSAWPCLASGKPLVPPVHTFYFQFQFTYSISILLFMLYLNYQSHTLICTYDMALAALGQLSRGKPLEPPSENV